MPFHRFRFLNDDHDHTDGDVRRAQVAVDNNATPSASPTTVVYLGTVYKLKQASGGPARPKGIGRPTGRYAHVYFNYRNWQGVVTNYSIANPDDDLQQAKTLDAGQFSPTQNYTWKALNVEVYHDRGQSWIVAFGIRQDPTGSESPIAFAPAQI